MPVVVNSKLKYFFLSGVGYIDAMGCNELAKANVGHQPKLFESHTPRDTRRFSVTIAALQSNGWGGPP